MEEKMKMMKNRPPQRVFGGQRKSIILLISILPPSFYEFNPDSLPSAPDARILFLHFCLVPLLSTILFYSALKNGISNLLLIKENNGITPLVP